MELEDFRRQWQHAAAEAPASVDAADLVQLLAEAGRNPIGQLRRNARWELGFTVVLLVGGLIGLIYVQGTERRTALILLISMCLISLVSYHRHLLNGIRGLSEVGATMHAHLAQRIADVRQILAASYRSVIWVLFVSLGINLAFSLYRILAQYSGWTLLLELSWLVLGGAVGGLIGYFGVRFFARRVLQELYGQHLDRLEEMLRELSETEIE